MSGSSDKAKAELPAALFGRPALPLVDGRGHIWRRFSSDPADMWDYTFGHQILAPYDFALSVQVVVKEFAPDVIRSEEHTSALQSLMRISYAVFCLQKKTKLKKYSNKIITILISFLSGNLPTK